LLQQQHNYLTLLHKLSVELLLKVGSSGTMEPRCTVPACTCYFPKST
jgi:hypothetical protein